MLVAMTGAGKTEMALALIASFRQPALWLCNTKTLAHQALARARKVYNLPPRAYGFIGEGEFGLGTHLTVATLQSLTKGRHRGIERRFGCIVVDECDLAPAISYSRVVSRFPARYRIGVTATPERGDGLGPLALDLLGPGMVRVEEKTLVLNKRIMVPTIRLTITNWAYWGSGDWTEVQQSRAADSARNALVCSIAAREFRNGHRVIILTELVRHVQLLVAMLGRAYGIPGIAVTGPVATNMRNKALRATQEGKAVLVATKLADRGLDLPILDRLVLAAPGRSMSRLEHQVGRILRTCPDKTDAIVYDLVDIRVGSLLAQAKLRIGYYHGKGYQVEKMARDALKV
jgi:superfamily II DNA or RNA helicase